MRFASASLALASATIAAAQQYAGDVIPGTLPQVDNAEVAFWKIRDPTDQNANLTLINYASLNTQGQRPDQSKIQRAVLSIHGLLRDPWNYENDMLNALNVATGYNSRVNRDTVSVIAPYFASGSDKTFAFPWDESAKAGRGSNTSAIVWRGSQWSAGGNNQYPHSHKGDISAFYIMDEIIRHFDDKSVYPNMKTIVLVGHSLGGQMMQRYAAVGDKLDTSARLVYWIGNPSSYTWLNSYRPMYIPDCPDYDVYRDGYADYEDYPMTYGADLVAKGTDAILENYDSRQIAYARALQDMGDHSSTCGANTTGANRNERFFNYIDWFRPNCPDPAGENCDTVDLIDTSHNNGYMFNSAAGQSRIFHDNFDMSCHLPCAGNTGQTCGGPGRLSLYSAEDESKLTKRDSAAAPMRFARLNERLDAMNKNNWRPRTDSLTKDSPKPDQGVSQEDAVNDVIPSGEQSEEEQNIDQGTSGEQLLGENNGNSTAPPSWANVPAQ